MLLYPIDIPFFADRHKADGFKHPPALGVESIDIRPDLIHALFPGQRDHFLNAAPPDAPVLAYNISLSHCVQYIRLPLIQKMHYTYHVNKKRVLSSVLEA